MKTLKKFPVLLALLVTVFVSACSEIEVDPRTDGEGDAPPIIVQPKSSTSSADTVSIG